jgi:hypothetical protein
MPQQSCHRILPLALLTALLGIGAGKISHPTPYDPILMGPPLGPCAPQLAGAATVSGTDIYGNPVLPADASPRIVGQMGSENITPELLVHLPNLERLRVNVRMAGLGEAVSDANEAGCLPQKPHSPPPGAANPDPS